MGFMRVATLLFGSERMLYSSILGPLFVDEEFHATSDKCITFDNPPLNGNSGTMEIVNVEIWTFE